MAWVVAGSLHQGDGMLIVYDVAAPDKTYEAAVETIHAMGEVIFNDLAK